MSYNKIKVFPYNISKAEGLHDGRIFFSKKMNHENEKDKMSRK